MFPVSIRIVFILGLMVYNRIREPLKESGEKQLCLAAMIIGGISALVIILSTDSKVKPADSKHRSM